MFSDTLRVDNHITSKLSLDTKLRHSSSHWSAASTRGVRPANLLKKRLWRRCFPVNFVKFLRTQNTSWKLLLTDVDYKMLKLNVNSSLLYITFVWYLEQVTHVVGSQKNMVCLYMEQLPQQPSDTCPLKLLQPNKSTGLWSLDWRDRFPRKWFWCPFRRRNHWYLYSLFEYYTKNTLLCYVKKYGKLWRWLKLVNLCVLAFSKPS